MAASVAVQVEVGFGARPIDDPARRFGALHDRAGIFAVRWWFVPRAWAELGVGLGNSSFVGSSPSTVLLGGTVPEVRIGYALISHASWAVHIDCKTQRLLGSDLTGEAREHGSTLDWKRKRMNGSG